MSHIPKRFISHATVAGKLYSSKKGKIVKEYLEKEGLTAWAKNTEGVDSAGAETARVTGAGHSGGSAASEPFHLNVEVKDKDGKPIKTVNPRTNKETKTWHAYIGKTKDDLYALANSWYEKHSGKK